VTQVILASAAIILIAAACGGGRSTASRAAAPAATGPGAETDDSGGVAAGPTQGGGLQLVSVGPKIVKTASITLEVKEGSFEQHAQDVTLIASRRGGFVASSRTSGDQRLSGTVVVRVPASQFEAALGELMALGKVTAQQIAGEDVTAQFVDLDARLRNWEAQESVLLGLMGKSTSIEDSLKVQQSLQEVQLAIEQIKGQLRLLTDQTDMSTISVAMTERPAAAEKKAGPFVEAWRSGVDAMAAVFTAIVVGLAFLAPLLLIAVAAGLGWVVFRRIRQRPVVTPLRR
jgi:hypothetical protein